MELSALSRRKTVVIEEPQDGDDGFVITFNPRGCPLEQFLEVYNNMPQTINEDGNVDQGSLASTVNAFLPMFDLIDLRWNITVDGEPYPATKESLLKMDAFLAVRVVQAVGSAFTDSLEKKDLTTSGSG